MHTRTAGNIDIKKSILFLRVKPNPTPEVVNSAQTSTGGKIKRIAAALKRFRRKCLRNCIACITDESLANATLTGAIYPQTRVELNVPALVHPRVL